MLSENSQCRKFQILSLVKSINKSVGSIFISTSISTWLVPGIMFLNWDSLSCSLVDIFSLPKLLWIAGQEAQERTHCPTLFTKFMKRI